MLKKCKYCGREFDPKGTSRVYCCPECQRQGAYEMRRQWVERTGFREKDAQRHRERNAAALAARNQEDEAKRQKLLEEQNRKAAELEADFEKKCQEGDPYSLMLKALQNGGNCTVEYWRAYQNYICSLTYLTEQHKDILVDRKSVYDADFPEEVVKTISEIGFVRIEEVDVI